MEEEVGYMRRTGRRSRIYEKKKSEIWEALEEEDGNMRKTGREDSKMRRIESKRW